MDRSATDEIEFPPKATPERLRELAKFYGERPCVELGKTPTLREISQGECADACIMFDAAADEIDHLRECLARFSGLASSALAPLQIMEQEAAVILRRMDAQETE